MGPGLVRRLPPLHLLLPPARAGHGPLNAVVTYDVAFKLVTVLGSLLLPLCAWAFGRWPGCGTPVRAAWPPPRSRSCSNPASRIYGGNLLSTLAGEFSFSLSLSLSLLFLGRGGRGPAHRSPPGPGRRALRRHPAVPPHPGALRRGRCRVWLAPRRRSPPDGGRGGPRRGRRPPVGAPTGLVARWPARSASGSPRGGCCRSGGAAVHHEHGLHQGLRLSPPALPGVRPLGAGRRPGGRGGHGGPAQPGGPLPRGDGRAVGGGHDRRPGLQALRRPVPPAVVPLHVPARRATHWPRSSPSSPGGGADGS